MSLLKLIPELGKANVRMKDPDAVEKAVRTMMKDAHHKLQVVADFDWTLSKHSENGQRCSTTHAVIETSEFMPSDFKKESRRLADIYLPIEFDGTMTQEEKIPKMIEWWNKGHALLVTSGLTQDRLSQIVAHSRARLRNGCDWFFDKLHEMDVPLLIVSAGIGDVIRETIKQQAKLYDNNMKIVSNFLHFDESGKMIGFAGKDIVHCFNKNESSILSPDYFYDIKHRENILLLGDSLGDLQMADGADNVQCMLKIGFLNLKVEESLQKYMHNFDVVIVEDESLDVVNGIFKAILAAHDSC